MNTEANFEIAETVENGVPVVVVHGELDVSTTPRLKDRVMSLAEQGHASAVVDLSAVTFVDSTALGALVSGVKRFRDNGGDLRLVVVDPHIEKVLEITGLTEVFAIFPTSTEAVSA